MKHQFKTITQHMYLIDVWIMCNNISEGLPRQKMYLCIWILFTQATNDRRGQYNITDGRKSYDEEFCHWSVTETKIILLCNLDLCEKFLRSGSLQQWLWP